MDETTLKKTFFLMMKRNVLESITLEQRFQKNVMSKFSELSKNQPKVIKITGMIGKMKASMKPLV